MGEVAPLRGGFAFKSSEFTKRGIPIVRISNILSDGRVGGEFAYYTEQSRDDNYLLPNNAALIAMSGATTGKVSILNNPTNLKIYQNQRVGYFVQSDKASYSFVSTLVKSHLFMDKLSSVLVSGAQPNISSKEINLFEFLIPVDYKEQNKIGVFFKQLDDLITLHQRKLISVKKVTFWVNKKWKNGLNMQFLEYSNVWEQRKLGDLVEEFSIKSKIENAYTVLSSTNSGMEVRDGRVSGSSNIGYKVIDNGDLVLSPQNLWLGNININDIGIGLVSPSYKTFKLTNIKDSFFKPQLRTKKMLEEYKNASTQGASVVRRNLEMDSFYQIPMFVPNSEEQEKIGSVFKQLDDLITLHQRKTI